MSFPNAIRTGRGRSIGLALVAALAIAAGGGSSWAGQPPRPAATASRPSASRRRSGPRTPARGPRTTTTSRTRAPPRQTPINSTTVVEAEGEVALRVQGREPFGAFASTPIVLERHRLPAGPELERLRARPLDRQAEVEAHVQQAEHRPERRCIRLRPHLRRDRDERLRARCRRPGSSSGRAS